MNSKVEIINENIDMQRAMKEFNKLSAERREEIENAVLFHVLEQKGYVFENGKLINKNNNINNHLKIVPNEKFIKN